MTSISSLEKRVDSLELGSTTFDDPIIMLLDALTDKELDVLQKYNSLQRCGYSELEIEKMMSEFSMVCEIAAKMKAMMDNLTEEERATLDKYNGLCRREYSEPEIELMMGRAAYALLSGIAAKMKAPS